jgi:hypothetical protein
VEHKASFLSSVFCLFYHSPFTKTFDLLCDSAADDETLLDNGPFANPIEVQTSAHEIDIYILTATNDVAQEDVKETIILYRVPLQWPNQPSYSSPAH